MVGEWFDGEENGMETVKYNGKEILKNVVGWRSLEVRGEEIYGR